LLLGELTLDAQGHHRFKQFSTDGSAAQRKDHTLLWDRLRSLHENWGFTADLRNVFLEPAPLDGYPPVHREKANSYQ
jgi:hypothetical protein